MLWLRYTFLIKKSVSLVKIYSLFLKFIFKKLLTNTGSSETTRGVFSLFLNFYLYYLNVFKKFFYSQQNNFLFSIKLNQKKTTSPYKFKAYDAIKPEHKKTLDFSFLEWFIGFSEGDGSFGAQDGYPVFVINQADLGVLYLIRTTLGFGRASTFVQKDAVYGRFIIVNEQNIYRLITIFNGNIHLEKVHARFTKWVELFNKKYNKNIVVLPTLSPNSISLNTAWLSGFFDAEGCCYSGYTNDEKMTNKMRLRLKASIDQKGEFPVLDQIKNLFAVKEVTIRDEEKQYYRVEVTSAETLALVIRYLDVFKLKGRKKQAYAVWKPLVVHYVNRTHLNFKAEVLLKKIQKTQKLNQAFKHEKNVITLLKKELESTI